MLRTLIASFATLPIAMSAACGDAEPDAPEPPAALLAWGEPSLDPVLTSVIAVPPSDDRFFTELVMSLDRFDPPHVDRVALAGDATGHLPIRDLGGGRVTLGESELAPGTALDVDLTTASAFFEGPEEHFSETLTVPPHTLPQAHLATDAVRTPDGTTWTATPLHGLVALQPWGHADAYRGVPSAAPFDDAFAGPQSDLVLALAETIPASDHAAPGLWVASAVTGLSRFTYGDALDRSDDRWEHSQPYDGSGTLEAQGAQTIMAMQATPDGVWAATLYGVWFISNELAWTHIADGAGLALTIDDRGHVWVGMSRQLDLTPDSVSDDDADTDGGSDGDSDGDQPPPNPGALLVIDDHGTPADPSDDTHEWRFADEPAVTSLAAAHDRDDTVLVGGVGHLRRAMVIADDPARGPLSLAQRLLIADARVPLRADLAVVDLAATSDGAVWLAARNECAANEGELMRLTFSAQGELAAEPVSLAGLGEGDVTRVRELRAVHGRPPELFLSTLVPQLASATFSASGCMPPPAAARTADSYVMALDARTTLGARRYGVVDP